MNGNDYQSSAGNVIPTPRHITKHKLPRTDAARELHHAINQAQEVIVRAKTTFPFTFFPDTIILDREKLTITHKFFFLTAETMSIRIKDILNVTADVGPFFGSVKFTTRYFNNMNHDDQHYTVKYLSRHDALRLKRITQGYIIALQKKIDCSTLSTAELTHMLDNLGT